jgi:aryl-alcohol dehydrogenase-like predicted oxidoreductase
MSAVSGIHSSKPTPVDPAKGVPLGQKSLLPQSYIPSGNTRITHKGAKDDVEVSPICIGAWSWGDTSTWHWKDEQRADVDAMWDECLKAGINFIDTAQVYGDGKSEQITGELVRRAGKREDVVVQTKYWMIPDMENLLHPVNSPVSKLKRSLERMKLDYVDIYLVHGHIHPQSIKKMAKGMAECVNQGLTRCVGVANYDTKDMLLFQKELEAHGIPLACNQVEFHPIRRAPEINGLLEECRKRDIVFQSYSSVAQGRLTGRYTKDNPPPKSYRFSSYPMEKLEPVLAVLGDIAQKRKVSVAAVTLNYNMSKGVLPVVGMRNPKQALEDAQALGWRLTEDEVAKIDEVSFEGKTTSLWQQG